MTGVQGFDCRHRVRGTCSGRRDQAAFNLAMAVRAYENALLRLLTQLGQGLPGGDAQCERLGGRIHMMEVEVDHAPVVSADGAAAARLRHEDALDLLQSASDGLAHAALASPPALPLPSAVAMKDDEAMTPAMPQLGGAIGLRRSALLTDQGRRRYRVGAGR
jgi:hypothetical protein